MCIRDRTHTVPDLGASDTPQIVVGEVRLIVANPVQAGGVFGRLAVQVVLHLQEAFPAVHPRLLPAQQAALAVAVHRLQRMVPRADHPGRTPRHIAHVPFRVSACQVDESVEVPLVVIEVIGLLDPVQPHRVHAVQRIVLVFYVRSVATPI